ncbi:hypothetical protein [Williamsoniiplasma lucivorax]|uniref:Transmembrane protein n=1 Tax=Williamsoniiplasma lucivorax TaxID=209274 RepID=A0A2S5RG60_9MOLU|nr:hypothetical protein [Williamsoniiplasma lucivorax]PPE06115.1 hypothetical protein ELUCI_v1c04060 [Williamsoniiplasma lucivorax]
MNKKKMFNILIKVYLLTFFLMVLHTFVPKSTDVVQFILFDFKYINFAFTILSSLFAAFVLFNLIGMYKTLRDKKTIKISKSAYCAFAIWVTSLMMQITVFSLFVQTQLGVFDNIFVNVTIVKQEIVNFLLWFQSFITLALVICSIASVILLFILIKIYKTLLIQSEEISSLRLWFTTFYRNIYRKQATYNFLGKIKDVLIQIIFLFWIYNQKQELTINAIHSTQLKNIKKGTTPPSFLFN